MITVLPVGACYDVGGICYLVSVIKIAALATYISYIFDLATVGAERCTWPRIISKLNASKKHQKYKCHNQPRNDIG